MKIWPYPVRVVTAPACFVACLGVALVMSTLAAVEAAADLTKNFVRKGRAA